MNVKPFQVAIFSTDQVNALRRCSIERLNVEERVYVDVESECYKSIPGMPVYPPSAPPVLPPDQWPAWAKLVAARRQPRDKGVGDTIHREAGLAGQTFKAAFAKLGVDCGCNARRDKFNVLYPYALTPSPMPPNVRTDSMLRLRGKTKRQ
jgi:hypothetical protein